MATTAIAQLLEREAELERIESVLERIAAGRGGVLLIEGPAGIGKSALAGRAQQLADERGMRIVHARGGELERDLPFGVVHQLFDAVVVRASDRERRALLTGPAKGALPLLLGENGESGSDPIDTGTALHALYWLTENLAADGPVLMAVDDAHWADEPSLRFIAFLARRIEHTPVLLAIAVRTSEGSTPEMTWLASVARETAAEVLRPAHLSREASAQLVRETYDADAHGSFCDACWEVTAGNPFFLRELILAADADQIRATPSGAERVRALSTDSIKRSVVARMGKISPAAGAIARAVSTLGTDVPLRLAAALAGIGAKEASSAADELAARGILRPERPLEFVHPVVRTSLYEDIPAGERSRSHRAAAELLANERAAPAAVAVHLLATEPAGDPWVAQALRAAASAARVPETEVAYLRRALAEPPPAEEIPAVLAELGSAEATTMVPDAAEHLERALRASGDPVQRARIALTLAQAVYWEGRFEEMRAMSHAAITELEPLGDEPEARELGLYLKAQFLWAHHAGERELAESLDELLSQAETASSGGEVALLARVGSMGALRGMSVDDVSSAARKALGSPHVPARHLAPRWRYHAIWALELCDEFDAAEEALAAELEEAEEVASPRGIATAITYLAVIALKRGRVHEAHERAERALELVREHELDWELPAAGATLAGALIERSDLAAAAEVLAVSEPPSDARLRAMASSGALHRFVRGRLALAQGDPHGAVSHLEQAGALMREVGHDHPCFYGWRGEAALAEALRGNAAVASELAAEELELAQSFGAPVPIGRALRIGGLTGGRVELLREAEEVLGQSPGELEHARAIINLGAALRRAGERREARDLLRRGLGNANSLGALAVAERARDELASIGDRPPRAAAAGIDNLTPSERRVAGMAAQGLTNPEIARALFLSIKTIEKHLGQTYLKLGIGSRRQLPQALEALEDPATAKE